MFVNLLELLQFIYLIKYCFIKRQAGSRRGRAAHSAAPGRREEVRVCALPAGHPACPSVCLMDHAARDRSPLRSSAVCFGSIL